MELVVKFEPFVLQQTIFIKHADGTIEQKDIPQKELASFISLQEDLSKVHFFGNKEFVSKVKEECLTKYKLKETIFCINC